MIVLVSSAAVIAAVAGWMAARFRLVPVVLVACSDGKTREISADDPRISHRI